MSTGSASTVVITGASSGIGRAAAEALALCGANVVLAARREQALEEVAQSCRDHGARALVVPTDVSDEAAVGTLSERAIEAFGGYDVWVSNAGVYLLGRVEETPIEDIRRVIEVDLMGSFYGARVAIAHFRRRGHGTLIQNSSLVAGLGGPYLSAYTAAKWGVRGLAEVVRQEVLDEPDIHVCTVRPASIDTPLWSRAANYTGRAVEPLSPVYPPEKVADAIVRLVERPRREVVVGSAGKLLTLEHALVPWLAERLFARQVEKSHLGKGAAPRGSGNLYRSPDDVASASGGWRHSPPAAVRAARRLRARTPQLGRDLVERARAAAR